LGEGHGTHLPDCAAAALAPFQGLARETPQDVAPLLVPWQEGQKVESPPKTGQGIVSVGGKEDLPHAQAADFLCYPILEETSVQPASEGNCAVLATEHLEDAPQMPPARRQNVVVLDNPPWLDVQQANRAAHDAPGALADTATTRDGHALPQVHAGTEGIAFPI